MSDKTGRTFWDAFSENKRFFYLIGILVLILAFVAIYNKYKINTPIISIEPLNKNEENTQEVKVDSTQIKNKQSEEPANIPRQSKINSTKQNNNKKIKKYQTWVIDQNGNGIEGVRIFCNTCLETEILTGIDGKLMLSKEFLENEQFLNSEIILSKNSKTKTLTIEWRDNSPQPIPF